MSRADDLSAPSFASFDDASRPVTDSRTGVPTIARVALDTPLPTLFDYRLDQAATLGQLVQFPFGRRQVVGVVWELTQRSDVPSAKLRDVTSVWHELPALGDDWRDLMQFAARYYQRGIGEVALPAVPGHLRTPMRWSRLLARRGVQRYRLADGALPALMENVPARLRAEVFRRDGNRCLKCGAQDDLHADHIVPVSLGGLTVIDNLQTLCSAENLSKGNRESRDYRKGNSVATS